MKLQKNHFYKFLSEITIIVIGVLIAFQLTNWGKQIEKKETEREVVSQIYFELNDNLVDLKNDVEIHRLALKSQQKVQQFLDGGASNADSLMMDFYWMSKEEYIFPNLSAFENLKSLGMNIIQNDSLRDLITLVYNNYFPRISKGNNLHPDISEYLNPFIQKNFRVNRNPNIKYTLKLAEPLKIDYPRDFGSGIKQLIGYIPLNEKELRENEEFRFLVSEILFFRIHKVHYYQMSIKNVEQILRIIEHNYPKAVFGKSK